jgi:EmrB/QacA subfamily drug resistance transporter
VTPASPPSAERVAVTVAAVASFLAPFSGAATNVALPSIARELRLDAVQLGWVGMSYLLAAAVCLVPFGRLADIHGRRLVFGWGALAYAGASLVCGLATTPGVLLAGRVLQGVGGAAIFATNVAILTSVLPPGRRGAALGVNSAAVYLGLSLGPFLGGLLTEQAGWRSLFLLGAALGLALALIVRALLRGEWAESKGESFDVAGSALYVGALLPLMFGVSLLPSRKGGALLLAGLVALAALVFWELRARQPVLPVGLLVANRVFALSNLAALVNYAATFAVGFLLSLYLQYVKGMGAQAAGLLLVVQPALMTAVSPFAGRLSDRVESRIVASIGMGVTAAGLALLCALGTTPLAFVAGCLALLGCGFGLFSSPNTNAVMGAVDRRFYGVASASLGTMRLTGQMLSMALATLLLTLFVGRVALTPAHAGPLVAATRVAFSVCAALCVLGTLASLARGSERFRRASAAPGT